jgi:surfeit locus 1 family protein
LETDSLFWRLAPPVAAILLIAAFVSLGFWQLDRAAEKVAQRKHFDNDVSYVLLSEASPLHDFQALRTTGHYIDDRQFLIDNMIFNGRPGYFVLTAFEYAPDKPLLMINRGWIATTGDRNVLPTIPPVEGTMEVRGRSGRLPRVGIRPGNALDGSTAWPKLANFPELPELADALGRELLPFVLLLDPDDTGTLVRDWQPKERGPMMHYGYAFQWFAMAATVLVILVWQLRKRRSNAEA